MVLNATPATTKDEIRRAVLERRDALSPAMRTQAAEAIAARQLPVALTAGMTISGFMPIRSEINGLPLLRRLAEAGVQVALPAIMRRGQPLTFRLWTLGEDLVRGQWGIREPPASSPAVDPDLVLAPLAAFDRRGFRIGYGAGYYDFTLNALRARRNIVALGLAYAMQEVERVPVEAHDARLDFVLTERETIACAP